LNCDLLAFTLFLKGGAQNNLRSKSCQKNRPV